MISDLQTYGLIKETSKDRFVITDVGKKTIHERKIGKSVTEDSLILALPIWKDVSEKLPLHPTKEMFFKALQEVLQEDIPNKHSQEMLWNRYNVEVLPALERKTKKSMFYGLIGVTLSPNFQTRITN
jgi:hypothetical protein